MNLTEKWILLVFIVLLSLLSTSTSQSEKTSRANLLDSDDPTTTAVPDGGIITEGNKAVVSVDCLKLLPGQFLCDEFPLIDNRTQQPRNCQRDTGKAPKALRCRAAPGLVCNESKNVTTDDQGGQGGEGGVFWKDVDCQWTNGYHFDTALLLSIFLGMFGADRFYLGYPALGLLKFSTLGFFFLGHLLDVILIATQVVGPADQSNYVINYFGPGVNILSTDMDTQRRPQADW